MAKKAVNKKEYVDPFATGVNYDMVIKSIPASTTIENHFKGKLSNEKIEWLKNDLKHYTNNNNKN